MKNRGIFYKLFTRLSMFFTISILVFLILFVFIKGVPHLSGSIFSLDFSSDNLSMTPAIITTLLIVFLGIFISGPIGIFTAIYLTEYSKKDSKFVEITRLVIETLAGIPSIIYALFGYLFFNIYLRFGYSVLSGVFTVSIMVLPPIIRSTEEALLSVDDSYKMASMSLGAGKLRTILKVLIPISIPGILSGIILAIGRIIGETAALLYTLGTSTNIPGSLKDSGITLSLHMYKLTSEGKYTGEAYATGVILLIIVFLLNGMSKYLSKRLERIGG